MTQEDLQRLEKNLTRSAKKASKYYIRGMVGHTESDQGFFPIESIPIFNPIKQSDTTLAELIEDVGKLNESHIKLQDSHNALQEEYNLYKQEENARHLQLENDHIELKNRVNALEIFSID
jgi:hypothetical protein